MTSKTILEAEQVLNKSNEIESFNGRFKLNLQADGNLVVYDTDDIGSTIWTSRTGQSDASFLKMQQDGNLVLYSTNGSPRWASDTFGKCSQPYLTLQNDGTLAMYAHDKQGIIWSSFTERSRLVPGVYTITPKNSSKCLQLSARNHQPLWSWSWVYGRGDAKIYPKDGNTAPNFSDPDMQAVAAQYWLVCRHPKDPQCYTISSLYYGSFLGLYKDERRDEAMNNGNGWVQGAPCSLESPCITWDIIPQDNESSFKIRYRTNSDWEMAVDGNQCLRVERNSDQSSHRFSFRRLDLRDAQIDKTSEWMSHVPDDTFMSQLSIPGTHESLALRPKDLIVRDIDNPRCQSRSPYQQLQGGIRILDCRFDIFDQPDPDLDCLYAYHGDAGVTGAQQGYSCGAMLQSVRLFLTQNPDETVIVSIGDDPGKTSTDRQTRITNAFDNDFRNFVSELFWQPSTRLTPKHLNEYKLGDFRGRIVLVHKNSFTENWTASRDHFLTSSYDAARNLPPNEGKTHVLDNVTYTKMWLRDIASGLSNDANLFKKSGFEVRAENHAWRAKADTDKDAIYRVDWNYGELPVSPLQSASYLDTVAASTYARVGSGRMGIVNLDFFEKFERAIWTIIQMNPQKR